MSIYLVFAANQQLRADEGCFPYLSDDNSLALVIAVWGRDVHCPSNSAVCAASAIPYSTYYKPMGDLPYISSEQGVGL